MKITLLFLILVMAYLFAFWAPKQGSIDSKEATTVTAVLAEQKTDAILVSQPSSGVPVENTETTYQTQASLKQKTSEMKDSKPEVMLSIEEFFSTQKKDSEIIQFLKQNKIQDFGAIMEDSRSILKPDPRLGGCFKGEVSLADDTRWKISMKHEFYRPGESNEGEYSIVLRTPKNKGVKAGGTYTRGLRSSSLLPGEIILEISPWEGIQLFYWALNDELVGNYYKKEAASNYSYLGTVKLRRGEGCE